MFDRHPPFDVEGRELEIFVLPSDYFLWTESLSRVLEGGGEAGGREGRVERKSPSPPPPVEQDMNEYFLLLREEVKLVARLVARTEDRYRPKGGARRDHVERGPEEGEGGGEQSWFLEELQLYSSQLKGGLESSLLGLVNLEERIASQAHESGGRTQWRLPEWEGMGEKEREGEQDFYSTLLPDIFFGKSEKKLFYLSEEEIQVMHRFALKTLKNGKNWKLKGRNTSDNFFAPFVIRQLLLLKTLINNSTRRGETQPDEELKRRFVHFSERLYDHLWVRKRSGEKDFALLDFSRSDVKVFEFLVEVLVMASEMVPPEEQGGLRECIANVHASLTFQSYREHIEVALTSDMMYREEDTDSSFLFSFVYSERSLLMLPSSRYPSLVVWSHMSGEMGEEVRRWGQEAVEEKGMWVESEVYVDDVSTSILFSRMKLLMKKIFSSCLEFQVSLSSLKSIYNIPLDLSPFETRKLALWRLSTDHQKASASLSSSSLLGSVLGSLGRTFESILCTSRQEYVGQSRLRPLDFKRKTQSLQSMQWRRRASSLPCVRSAAAPVKGSSPSSSALKEEDDEPMQILSCGLDCSWGSLLPKEVERRADHEEEEEKPRKEKRRECLDCLLLSSLYSAVWDKLPSIFKNAVQFLRTGNENLLRNARIMDRIAWSAFSHFLNFFKSVQRPIFLRRLKNSQNDNRYLKLLLYSVVWMEAKLLYLPPQVPPPPSSAAWEEEERRFLEQILFLRTELESLTKTAQLLGPGREGYGMACLNSWRSQTFLSSM